MQAYYEWERFGVTAGIRNVADEDPPYVSAYDDMNTIQYSYDTQGRYFYVRGAVRF